MNPHLVPWKVSADDFPADGYASDQLEFLLAYAVLAPSNHNTQPWRFRVNASNVELLADRHRAIRAIDPYDRELTLSCGAALYNLRVAAEYFGHRYSVELLPTPSTRTSWRGSTSGCAATPRPRTSCSFTPSRDDGPTGSRSVRTPCRPKS